jgi:hypothetical protein
MASAEWAAQFMQTLGQNPLVLADVLRACDVMPTRGFRFPNRAGDMELLVTPHGVSAMLPADDADGGRDALRAALRAAGAAPDAASSVWALHEFGEVDEPLTAADNRRAWAEFARVVQTAYDTRLCACSRQLCRTSCFQCAVDGGRPGLPAAPGHLGELAKAAMAGSGGWTSRSERAGLCAIGVGECPERPAKQLRLDCGHVFCGGCLSRVLGLRCPVCRAPTARLSVVYFS